MNEHEQAAAALRNVPICDYIEAAAHQQEQPGCRCQKCRNWWAYLGKPTETPEGWRWGPFDAAEIYTAGGQIPLHRVADVRPV